MCEGFIELRPERGGARGNHLKIFKHRPIHDLKKNSFPHRVVNIWNELPAEVVSAETVIAFERKLDRFLASQDMVFDYKAKYQTQYEKAKYSDGTGRPISEYELDLVQEAS